MTVRLIAISRPIPDDIPGTQALLAFCARVSSTANQLNHETGGKLLRSLVRRKEWSPFEMISLTMEIESTRDIVRQILRHRSFSFQEYSQRYAAVTEPAVLRECRFQDTADRQNSLNAEQAADKFEQVTSREHAVQEVIESANWWRQAQQDVATYTANAYKHALERGIAKEVARNVLPEGMTPSRLYMAGTLRSWLHYCDLRCDPKTQREHQLIALACRDILVAELPELADVIGGQTDG